MLYAYGKLKYTMQIPHLLLNIGVPSMNNPWNWVTDLHLWMLHDGWRTSAPPKNSTTTDPGVASSRGDP